MNGWRNVLFSIVDDPLTEAEQASLRRLDVDWVLINRRSGRFFIDIIAPVRQLIAIRDRLTALGRDPIVIAIFDADGVMEGEPNKAEWLKVARDVNGQRPVAYVEVHHWAGWAQKIIP